VTTTGPAAAEWAHLWRHRSAPEIRLRDRLVLIALTAAGCVSVIRLADWWFRRTHVADPWLFIALSLAFWYGISRIVLGWVNYLAIARPQHQPAPAGLRVAIFTTSSPGEPLAMFETTLAGCARVRYPHTTYLLDDTRDPRFRQLAARHGAVWLELLDIPGAKAGKINRALELTSEPLVLVLDPDHVPFPEFLDRVLGHFGDSSVGFVQVSQAYYNQHRSFTAAAAAEQTYAFYGPGLMGLYGHGASVAIGANCTFRRAALASIGGHGVGLAEDLVTAIRLHAQGWRSVYVPEIVSRGLVPEDLGSYYRQQLKWSRGVYEVAFSEIPRLWARLTGRQRLAYLAIGTYYLFGLSTALYLVLPYIYLWTGVEPTHMRFAGFVLAVAPVGAIGAAIYLYAQRWFCDPAIERGLQWRGLLLKIACWPIFAIGTFLAIARVDIPYIPTPKQGLRGRFLRLAWPHLLLLGLYAVTFAYVVWTRVFTENAWLDRSPEAVWGMLLFASVPALAVLGALYAAWQSSRPPAEGAWSRIDMTAVGGAD
jgi:cellulose synthase (UDP-forming)